MDLDWLHRNWALAAAGLLVVPAIVAVLRALVRRSAHGRLRAAASGAHQARRHYRRLAARQQKLERRVGTLRASAAHVKPRILQEAIDSLDDMAALLKIAGDQVQISENQVRKIIYSEYPPARQAQLLAKYLPQDTPDTRPFSF